MFDPQILRHQNFPSIIHLLLPTFCFLSQGNVSRLPKFWLSQATLTYFLGYRPSAKSSELLTNIHKATIPFSSFDLALLLLSFIRIGLRAPIKRFVVNYQVFSQMVALLISKAMGLRSHQSGSSAFCNSLTETAPRVVIETSGTALLWIHFSHSIRI